MNYEESCPNNIPIKYIVQTTISVNTELRLSQFKFKGKFVLFVDIFLRYWTGHIQTGNI